MPTVSPRLDAQFPWLHEHIQEELRRLMRVLEARFVPLEAVKADWLAETDQLISVGLQRINDALAPIVINIQSLSDLGFMTAPSTYSVELVSDANKTWIIDAGPQRDNFRPTPFVYIQDNNNIETWALGRLLGYNHTTGVLEVRIEYIGALAAPGPHTDWTISMSPAAVPAIYDVVNAASDIRDEIVDAQIDVHADQVAAAASQSAAATSATNAAASASSASASAAAAATFNPANFYTKTQDDALLAGKANTAHTHVAANITDFNAAADARIAAQSLQIGDVLISARSNPGANYFLLDGSLHLITDAPALNTVLGNNYANLAAPTVPTLPTGSYPSIIWDSTLALFIAGGANVSNGALATAPSPGTTWTSRDTTLARKWYGLATRGGGNLLIASTSGEVKKSADGVTWTAATTILWSTNALNGTGGTFYGGALVAVGSTWVAFGDGSSAPLEIFTSINDGTSWTSRTSALTPGDLPGPAASSGSIIVQLARATNGVWQTSTDGITWTRRTGGLWLAANSVIRYTNGRFIISGLTNGRGTIHVSTDGINWTMYIVPYQFSAGDIVNNVSIFYLIGYVAPVYAFQVLGALSDTLLTTDFMRWRRCPTNLLPNIYALNGTNDGTNLVFVTNSNVVQKTAFDHNIATQFRVPLVDDAFIPRWIKAT